MDERTTTADPVPRDVYLRDVAGRLAGSRRTRTRLLAEIRDHLDDAAAANRSAGMHPLQAEQRAVELLGNPASLAEGWEARCSRLRRRRRGRAAMLIATSAIASILAAAQHADGHRDPAATAARCRVARSSTAADCRPPGS